jgi:molybdopterin biosynthesis enzyme MoaB
LVRVGVLAISGGSDAVDDVGHAAWLRSGGEEVERSLPHNQFALLRLLTLPRNRCEEVAAVLRDWCDAPNPAFQCRIILTLGGDGFAPGDVVPEATRQVIDRDAPGLMEILRQLAIERSDNPAIAIKRVAMNRAVAGIRKQTVIVNLPSCFERPAEAIDALLPLLPDIVAELATI